MLLWSLVLLFFALFAGIGYAKGSIRMLVTFIGLILGIGLAFPMAPLVQSLIAKKIQNPAWLYFLSPLTIFVLFNLVFFIASFLVHHVVQLKIKFSRSEEAFQAWRKLNARLGMCLGFGVGATYSLACCIMVYSVGSFTMQMASPGNDPGWLSLVNRLKNDLNGSGLNKLVARFDSTPERYYEVANMLGLIYNNPRVLPRLALYPPFIGLTEKGEISEIAKDDQYAGLFRNQAGLLPIIENPKTQAVLNNPDLLGKLINTDFEDLEEYLKTGYSMNYQDEKILGRWKVSPGAIMKQVKRNNPEISTEELIAHKRLATMIVAGINLSITTENEIFVKNEPTEVQQRFTERQARIIAQQAAESQVNANRIQSLQDQRMNDRYGISSPSQNQREQAVEEPKPKEENPLSFQIAGSGSWQKAQGDSLIGDKYKVTLPAPGGKTVKMDAEVRNNRLFIYTEGLTLVLHKHVI